MQEANPSQTKANPRLGFPRLTPQCYREKNMMAPSKMVQHMQGSKKHKLWPSNMQKSKAAQTGPSRTVQNMQESNTAHATPCVHIRGGWHWMAPSWTVQLACKNLILGSCQHCPRRWYGIQRHPVWTYQMRIASGTHTCVYVENFVKIFNFNFCLEWKSL